MDPIEIIQNAITVGLINEDHEVVTLELWPPLDDRALDHFSQQLPCAIPKAYLDLLKFASGISGAAAEIDFTGQEHFFEFPAIFPKGLPIAGDGYGNFWVADLWPDSQEIGPIYYACHDPPIILYQGTNVATFLEELFKMDKPPHESLVDDVHEDRLFRVWETNPGVRSRRQCLEQNDSELRQFAQGLDDEYEIVDMRNCPIGYGFTWGRYGPKTLIRRFGSQPIFGYRKPGATIKWFP